MNLVQRWRDDSREQCINVIQLLAIGVVNSEPPPAARVCVVDVVDCASHVQFENFNVEYQWLSGQLNIINKNLAHSKCASIYVDRFLAMHEHMVVFKQ